MCKGSQLACIHKAWHIQEKYTFMQINLKGDKMKQNIPPQWFFFYSEVFLLINWKNTLEVEWRQSWKTGAGRAKEVQLIGSSSAAPNLTPSPRLTRSTPPLPPPSPPAEASARGAQRLPIWSPITISREPRPMGRVLTQCLR